MNLRQKWYSVFAVLTSVSLLGGATIATAASETPTRAEAQAALAHIDQDQAIVKAYLDSLDATPTPDPTLTPPPTTPAGTANPTEVKATPASTTITLTWQPPTDGTPTGYIVGRDGVDNTGYGAYQSDPLPTTARSVVFDKLINGTAYNVYVEAIYSTGNKRVTVSSTPVAAATPTPTTTTPPASARPSGLPWSSGVWADGDPVDYAAFTAMRGKALDNVLVYTDRTSHARQNNPTNWKEQMPTNFNGVSQDLVLGLTTWTYDGAYMTAAQASQIGASVCSVDGTHPIVRLDWEMNLPDSAGENGAMLTASNYTAWVSRFNAVATALKAQSCGILIDFNPNVGVDQTSGCNSGTYAAPNNCTRRAFQAVKANVDIFGLDTYDSYPPVTSSGSGWSARSNGSSFGSLENSRLYAVTNAKKFSVPEWGVACNVSGCQWQGNAGGDDPEYMKRMVAYFRANASDMAYETYFNEYNPYLLSDLIDHNPNSRAAYKAAL